MEGWHLDKDILVKGNKIYSPETCCLVPCEINNIFKKERSDKGKYPVGVSLEKSTGKFIVQISKFGVRYRVGSYKTVDEAEEVYLKEKKEFFDEVIKKWKGLISEGVYEAICNYQNYK